MKVSLRSLLIIPFMLQVVGVTALVGYLSYQSGQRAVENLAQQLMAETGARVTQKLDSFLYAPQRLNQFNS